MKIKVLVAAMLACAINVMAQGYQDGIDYYNAYRLDDAKEILNKNLNNADTDKALAYYYLGLIDIEQNNPAAAKDKFEAGIAANAKSPYCYIGMGQIALANDPKAAATYFKEAEKYGKKDAAVSAAIGRAYFNVDPKVYNKEISKYIQKGHKESKFSSPAIYMLEGDTAAYHHNAGAAAGFYETAVRMAKDNGDARINPEAYVKNANLHKKINPKYAVEQLELLTNDLPNSALAQAALAEGYYEQDRLEDAIRQYQYVIQNPNHFARDEQRFGGLLFLANARSQALEMFDKVLADDPNNFFAKRMRMYCLYELGRNDEAKAQAQEFFSLTDEPFNFKDYEYYGDILSEAGDNTAAAKAYLNAYNVDKSKTDVLNKLAYEYFVTDDYADAVDIQKQYVDLGNREWFPLFRLATYSKSYGEDLNAKGDSVAAANVFNSAIAAIDEAISQEPDRANLYRTKGLIQYSANGKKPSLDMVNSFLKYNDMLIAEDPENYLDKNANTLPQIYFYTAQYYLGQQDRENAKKWLIEYLKLDPENEQIQNFVKNL